MTNEIRVSKNCFDISWNKDNKGRSKLWHLEDENYLQIKAVE
jgi:hypothetical protein